MNTSLISLTVAVLSSSMTFFVAWLVRRDTQGRNSAAESTRLSELERRIFVLEDNRVFRRDLEVLSQRLDAIQTDIREIRNYQIAHANLKPLLS